MARGTSAKTINLKVMAQTDAFAKKLAELPGMTEKEAKKAGAKLAKQFEKAEKAAAKNANKTAQAWDKAFEDLQVGGTNFGSVIKTLKSPQAALVAGLAAAAGGFVAAGAAMREYTNNIMNMAAITGLSVEATAGLEFAAKEAGIELETLKGGLQALNQKAGDAVTAGGEAALIFERLGINVKEAGGKLKPMESLIGEVVDSVSAMKDETLAASLAQKLLGGEGVLLTAALKDGSGALAEWTERVRESGMVSGSMQNDADMMNKALTEVAFEWRAFVQVIGREAVPALEALAAALMGVRQAVDWISDVSGALALKLSPALAENIRLENEMIASGDLLYRTNQDVAASMTTMSDAANQLRDSLVGAVVKAARDAHRAQRSLQREMDGATEATHRLDDALESNRDTIDERRAALHAAGALDEQAQQHLAALASSLDRASRAQEELTRRRERSSKAAAAQAEARSKADAAAREEEARLKALATAQEKWNDEILRLTEGDDLAVLVARLKEIGAAQMQGALDAAQAQQLVTAANAEYRASVEATRLAEDAAADAKEQSDKDELKRLREKQAAEISAVLSAGEAIVGALGDTAAKDFKMKQALATSEVLLRSAVGVVNILSGSSGPIVKGVQLAALTAASAASLANIASMTPPKMHTGGIVPDERPAQLLTGEGVLSRQGVANLGGEGAVHAINAGRGAGQAQVIQMVYKHRVLDTVIRDQLRSDSSLKRAIRGTSRIGHS